MEYKLGWLAKEFNLHLKGNGDVQICRADALDSASKGDITFAAAEKHLSFAASSKASAIVVGSKWDLSIMEGRNLLLADDAKLAFARIALLLSKRKEEYIGVHPKAFISDSSQIAENVSIYPFSYIGNNTVIENGVIVYPHVFVGDNCRIGEGTVLHAGVSIYHDCSIGKNCILHSGTVIGSDGFGFVRDGDMNVKFPQTGGVVIGDDCELGANNTVDRAAFHETVLGNNIKTDNLVHIGHNCKIGDGTIIIATSALAGSATFGKNVTMGGNSGVVDHITIGDNSIIGTTSIVTKDMPPGSVWTGYPAIDHKTWLRCAAFFPKMPEIAKKVKQLELEFKHLRDLFQGNK